MDEWLMFFIEELRSQAKTSYNRTQQLRELQAWYEKEYPGSTTMDTFARQ